MLVAGSDGLQIGTGASTATLVYVSGSAFQVDWIEFGSVTAVAGTTWGAVKQFFR